MKVAVIGAGAMGTALAIVFHEAGGEVTLCGTEFDSGVLDALEQQKVHPTLQLGVGPSIELRRAGDWQDALGSAEVVGLAVSSEGARDTVRLAVADLRDDAVWAVATKGWEPASGRPLSELMAAESPDHPAVMVVGPSLAGEMARGVPTALLCACGDIEAARKVAKALDAPTVGTFVSDDVVGVEVGAAMKNVLAIAIGLCDGIAERQGKPMTNTKAAIFSRGLVEMARVAEALGGRRDTVLGLAGAGDLFVTVLGGRNGRFGRLVGGGTPPGKALAEMGTTVEGYRSTVEAAALADRCGVEAPVVALVHSVLYENAVPEEAVGALVLREIAPEM